MKLNKNIKIFPAMILFLSLGLLTIQSNVYAAEKTSSNNTISDIASSQVLFEYQLENRTDPFMPFIKEQKTVSQINMNEIVSPDESLLTGMQLFEPDQLKVVGLMAVGENKLAMVQDLIGQGYTIGLGTLIGKRGTVKDITPKGVIIEETAVTRAGKKKITTIMMTLKPEGEE